MRASIKALFGIAAVLSVAAIDGASAQKYDNGRAATTGDRKPTGGDGGYPGRPGVRFPGIVLTVPTRVEPEVYVDDRPQRPKKAAPKKPARARQPAPQRAASNAPPANERRYVPDEVVVEMRGAATPQQFALLQIRHRLTPLETQPNQLAGTTLYRLRIPAGTSVTAVVRALEADNAVATAQPNYRFTLQQAAAPPQGAAAQYELAKLRLPQAHTLTLGADILVAVIDSGVDRGHSELDGSVADEFNALASPMAADKHGTAIAGLVAAHATLTGAAPKARLLAARAFDPHDAGVDGTTFAILRSLDWAATRGARVINMSFAGPPDPALHRSLEAAYKQGIVLVAAAGNAGAQSPPLYPAADANVIAVSATGVDDRLFDMSNRGPHIAIAAPGADIMVAIPGGGYEVSSGTSYSAAEVSGVVALMLAMRGDLSPDAVRAILQATAKDIGPKGRDVMFGAGLADAFSAVSAEAIAVAATAKSDVKPKVERVSTQPR